MTYHVEWQNKNTWIPYFRTTDFMEAVQAFYEAESFHPIRGIVRIVIMRNN
jgi:hypothetical protein